MLCYHHFQYLNSDGYGLFHDVFHAPPAPISMLPHHVFFVIVVGPWLNIEIGGAGAQWFGKPTEFKFSTSYHLQYLNSDGYGQFHDVLHAPPTPISMLQLEILGTL